VCSSTSREVLQCQQKESSAKKTENVAHCGGELEVDLAEYVGGDVLWGVEA
jgi:hypothetical protein